MTKLYLGVDLGGTEVKLAIVDEKGKICKESVFPNNYSSAPKDVIAEIIARARKLEAFKKLSGTGVGVAGDIDQINGVVRFSPNLEAWKNVPLKAMLEKELPGPVVVDNDANAAALGAYWLDAKGKANNLICITLGTGVGGGIICNGTLHRGATGTAGEIGHMTLDPNGPRCKCGNMGCIERYLGARYLSVEAMEQVKMGKSKIIPRLVEGRLPDITPHILFMAAQKGDPLARDIWHTAGQRLGIVIASLINLLNPEMIVLAGGVSQAGQLILKPIRDTVKLRAFSTPSRACKIVVSRFHKRLGVVGAALLAK
jgi:glucokinase